MVHAAEGKRPAAQLVEQAAHAPSVGEDVLQVFPAAQVQRAAPVFVVP